MELNDTLCYCFHITRRKIVNFIRVEKPRRPSQLAECGGAGTGCGWCVPFLKRCYEQGVNAGDTVADISANEYAQQRAAYIRAGKGKPAAGALPLPEESSEPGAEVASPNPMG